ncbi:MAG: nucleoside-triphosphatase [Nitrososphaeraceae archaeon]
MAVIVLTGAPGVGKTTIVRDVAQKLNERGVRVGGIISREVRTNNVRTGFELIDLTTNDREILASVTENGPRAANRLINALINVDIIICDEIGPMELESKEFIDAARNLITTDKNVIVVVHQKLEHPLVSEFREKSSSLVSINLRNRNEVSKILLNRLNV